MEEKSTWIITENSPFEMNSKREETIDNIINAWNTLNIKLLKKVFSSGIKIYDDRELCSANGIENVIKCHSVWFEKIRTNMSNGVNASVQIKDNYNTSDVIYILIHDEDSYEDLLVMGAMFNGNRLNFLLICHDHFDRIMRKYEKVRKGTDSQ